MSDTGSNDGSDFDPFSMDDQGYFGGNDPISNTPVPVDPATGAATDPTSGQPVDPSTLNPTLTDPSLQSPATNFMLNGPPLLQNPNLSDELLRAGIGVLNANQAGEGFSGLVAGGLQGYANSLDTQYAKARQARADQIAQYNLLGEIQQRQQAQLMMAKKLQAQDALSQTNPDLANLLAIDPEAASKVVAAKMMGPRFENVGGQLVKIVPGQDPQLVNLSQLQGGQSAVGNPTAGLTGDDFASALQATNPARLALLKQYQAGKLALPTGKQLQTPYGQQLVGDLTALDPNGVDSIINGGRAATWKSATSGQIGKNANAMSTAIEHAGVLDNLVDPLDNMSGFPGATLVNSAKNAIASSAGNPAITNFNTAKQNFLDETGAVYRNAGATDAEIKERQANLNSAGSPEQLHSAIKEQVEMMHAKLDSLNDQVNKGMGTTENPITLLSPAALKTAQKFGLVDDKNPPTPLVNYGSKLSVQQMPTAASPDLMPASSVSPALAPLANVIDRASSPKVQASAANAIIAPGSPGLMLPGGTPPAANPLAAAPQIYTPQTQADYDAIPSGAIYIGSDGKKKRKK